MTRSGSAAPTAGPPPSKPSGPMPLPPRWRTPATPGPLAEPDLRGPNRSGGQVLFDGGHQVGILGSDGGRKAGHRLTFGGHHELLKVPADVAAVALAVAELVELRIERALVRSVHVDLVEQRER